MQLAQHFRPFARRIPKGVRITAGRINRPLKYAIIIRIGDPHLQSNPGRTQSDMAKELEQAVNKSNAPIYLNCACKTMPNFLLTAGIGLACAAGVYLVSDHDPMTAGLALFTGATAHLVYEKFVSDRQLNELTEAASDGIRQFRPYGPPPREPERFYTEPDSGIAIIYRQL